MHPGVSGSTILRSFLIKRIPAALFGDIFKPESLWQGFFANTPTLLSLYRQQLAKHRARFSKSARVRKNPRAFGVNSGAFEEILARLDEHRARLRKSARVWPITERVWINPRAFEKIRARLAEHRARLNKS
ncbi:MAG TPA: hypothetical protein VK255_04530 [Patescibacteria group bacterium]|nr:hypothetical protein [Patescibacteria group bacterium]